MSYHRSGVAMLGLESRGRRTVAEEILRHNESILDCLLRDLVTHNPESTMIPYLEAPPTILCWK